MLDHCACFECWWQNSEIDLDHKGDISENARINREIMLTAIILWIVSTALPIFSYSRDRRSPLSWSLWIWVGVSLIHVFRPIALQEISSLAVLILTVGLITMTAPMMRNKK